MYICTNSSFLSFVRFCSIIVSNSAYGGVIVPTDLILADYAEQIGFEVGEGVIK